MSRVDDEYPLCDLQEQNNSSSIVDDDNKLARATDERTFLSTAASNDEQSYKKPLGKKYFSFLLM